MEHPRIDDENILDRYLAGELPADEEALFEEHLFECADCLEKAEWGEEMRRGLRSVRAHDASRADLPPAILPWPRSRPARLAGFAAFALAFVALLGALWWQQNELGRVREEVRLAAAGPAFVEPTGDFLVVSLGVVRDATGIVEIRPETGREVVLLSLELQTVEAARYRVDLRNDEGDVLWSGEDLEPNLYDSLLVALPSSFLAPGDYRIAIAAMSAAGEEPAGELAFRVLPEN